MKPRPLVIPVFIPHEGCPRRCIFCDQTAITRTPGRPFSGAALISKALQTYQPHGRNRNRPVQIAFFGGNFLGLPNGKIAELLTVAKKGVEQGLFDAIRFSTRPDTVDDRKLELIAPVPVETVEIGAQSMDDRVLEKSRRGHRVEDTVRAAERLQRNQYQTVVQLMVGLPGESKATLEMNASAVCRLAPDFVRIYPTLVLAGSPLAEAFRIGTYQPLTLEEAVEKSAVLAARFLQNGIAVIRMGLPADVAADPQQLLAGPYHPAFGHLVYERLYFTTVEKMFSKSKPLKKVTLRVHPGGISAMRGLNNGNVDRLIEQFSLNHVTVAPDKTLERYQVAFGEQCRSILGTA